MITEIETLKKFAFLYYLDDDWVIIAGKTSKDNDFISLKVAGQTDWWFHIRGMSGSHVLLRSLSDGEASKKQLEIAAEAIDFIFLGKGFKQFIQVGNAVPPRLAEIIGEAIMEVLE